MTGLRALLRGLTLRGRCLLAAGAALVVAAAVLGQDDLLRVALFLLVLPPLAVAVVARTRYRLTCTRVLEPVRVPAGQDSGVHLTLDNASRLPSGVMLMEDTLPPALGARPRFVLDRVEPAGVREVTYAVRSPSRGRFTVGPLSVRLSDPFGLCELHRSFTATSELVVTPVVTTLPRVRLGGDRSGGGEASSAALSAGSNDVTTREYRHGDDLRRVHWRSTARLGELMVRQEEQPRQERATLLLDTRRRAHRGDGAESSFEWAVSAVASIGVSLLQGGFALGFETDDGVQALPVGTPVDEAVLLDVLSEVGASGGNGLELGLDRIGHSRSDGVVVAVLGDLDAVQAERVSRLTPSATRVAVLLDASSWAGTGTRTGTTAAAGVLRGSGWRVLEVARGSSLAAVWGLLVQRGAGLARAGAPV